MRDCRKNLRSFNLLWPHRTTLLLKRAQEDRGVTDVDVSQLDRYLVVTWLINHVFCCIKTILQIRNLNWNL